MSNIKNRKEGGFTIIEVLIVLAIAGLIMLIVFLAVPALQRNSRNTQRKNDVSALLSAVTEYANNQAGKLPTATDKDNVIPNAKLGFYETANITFSNQAVDNGNNTENVTIAMKSKCDADGDASTGTGRQFVALYTVETGSSKQKICQEG